MRNILKIAILLVLPAICYGQAAKEFNVGGGVALPQQEFAEKNTPEAGLAVNGIQYHAGLSWLRKNFGFRLQYHGAFFPLDAQYMADELAAEHNDMNWHVSASSWIMNGIHAGGIYHHTFAEKLRLQAILSAGTVIYRCPESTISGVPTNAMNPPLGYTMYSKDAWGIGYSGELRAGYFFNEKIAIEAGANYYRGYAKFEQVPVSSGASGNFEQYFAFAGCTISFIKKF